ncbi:geranylgeranyl pyrophosphate synthetase [Massarina eburnea CBS 473.64]|uniref:Geranylgeranyl pyrophosphate synthetase n=1 Tax=Massarina eburnea CBS 473.64 TaxID=1395130 RepID=A0A6A6SIR3_9PLEO|nr:geranylgeranyl pyrophosphate synthetase [Massarina eburnea CBS 473.64]
MANKPIAVISRQDLKDLNTPASASITEVEHLTSYNWIEAPRTTPTIAVPGSPALWAPPNGPFRPAKDTGHVYISQNAARHPDSPLEPLFRALYTSHPSFDISSIDIVTDRNNIRKLLSLINPRWSSNKREDFTINVEVTNNTAIFNRDETKTEEYISPKEFKGYGHTFEKKCTRNQINGSTGHHRILSYSFGNLKFLVRHETDGYVGVTIPHLPAEVANDDEDLSVILDTLSLSRASNRPTKTYPSDTILAVRKGGHTVPMSATLEIKTRVSHRPLAIEDVVSQLWVSQTPKLVRAYHTKGEFAVPRVEDVAGYVEAWEAQNQGDLRMLAGLIGRIRDVVREGGGRARVRYDAGRDRLVVSRLGGRQMLPKDLYGKWEGKGGGERSGDLDVKIVEQALRKRDV